MRKNSNWNNNRRTKWYWYSLIMLLFVSENIGVILSGKVKSLCYNLYNIFYKFFANKIDMGYGSIAKISYIFLIVVTMLIIFLINYIISNIDLENSWKPQIIYGFIYKKECICDIIIGMILEISALYSILELRSNGAIFNSISILYFFIMIIGSIGYWHSIMPITEYKKRVEKIVEPNQFSECIWYGLTNSDYRISSLMALPRKNKQEIIIIDKLDIEMLREKKIIQMQMFSKCAIIIDGNFDISSDFLNEINKLIVIPYLIINIFYIKGSLEKDQINCLESYYRPIREIQLKELNYERLDDRVNILYELEYCERFSIVYKGNPLNSVLERRLREECLNICNGPILYIKFLKICMLNLEIAPALYALFDCIDLQYRLVMAFVFPKDREWYRHNGRNIGNVSMMGKIIESSTEFFDKKIIFLRDNIFHDQEIVLLNKYLPNYHPPSKYTYKEIYHLSAKLRNAIRGHGTFDVFDMNQLYILIFKLVLLTSCMLGTNSISLMVQQNTVWGKYKNTAEYNLDPFVKCNREGDIIIFNNWVKGKIEYINFLNGKTSLD